MWGTARRCLMSIENQAQQDRESPGKLEKVLGSEVGASGSNEIDNDSEEFFTATEVPDRVKGFVDEVFKEYDDVYATFVDKRPIPTENNTPSVMHINSPFSGSSKFTSGTESTPGTPKFLSAEVKAARRQAMIDGQNDLKELLKNSGIRYSSYFSVLYSSKKGTDVEKTKFGCSRPLRDCGPMLSTPKNTGPCNRDAPLSGIKQLPSTPGISSLNNICPSTPTFRQILQIATTPNFSPVSSGVKTPTLPLFEGIVCYVDVRTDKENRTDSVKKELVSLGAVVEKNFTRKVTHVIFKEGRRSTYIKAKKLEVTIVSVLWIEACKAACTILDPKLYPPQQMEKYESILPFQTLKKRRLNFMKKVNERTKDKNENKNTRNPQVTDSSDKVILLRNAVTDIKEVCGKVETRKPSEPNFPIKKKLDFGTKIQEEYPIITLDDSESDDDSTDSFSSLKGKEFPRRKSAPATMVPVKRKRKRLDKENSPLKSDLNSQGDTKAEEDPLKINENVPLQTDENCVRKKRKLFDPTQSYLSQPSTDEEGTPSVVNPYINVNASQRRGPRTKATSVRMRFGKKLDSIRKRKAPKSEEENEMFLSCSKRSSIALFLPPKPCVAPVHAKSSPVIVCTSFRAEELDNMEKIIKDLGVFTLEPVVNERTTHVVSNGPRRTLNLLKGIVRGCWILGVDWIYKSSEAGKWLSEELFEMQNFSPAVLQNRLERQAFGRNVHMDLFSSCGGIYVSRCTVPPCSDLSELLRLCKGRVVTTARAANIIIGGKPSPNTPDGVLRVMEKWVLDSITFNSLCDTSKYAIVQDRVGPSG